MNNPCFVDVNIGKYKNFIVGFSKQRQSVTSNGINVTWSTDS